MVGKNQVRAWAKMLSIFALILGLMIYMPLFAGEPNSKSQGPLKGQPDFLLTVNQGLISLSARDASLKAILEALGRKAAIDVIAHIPAEEKITVEFDQLPIEEAMKRLSKNYVYQMNSDAQAGKITAIIVLPEGEETLLSKEDVNSTDALSETPARSEPFKFEFDPSQYEKSP